MDDKSKKDSRLEGEGSYSGTKSYNKATARFLKKGKVDEAAREASRALESQEGAELKAAEAKGRAGDPRMREKSPSAEIGNPGGRHESKRDHDPRCLHRPS